MLSKITRIHTRQLRRPPQELIDRLQTFIDERYTAPEIPPCPPQANGSPKAWTPSQPRESSIPPASNRSVLASPQLDALAYEEVPLSSPSPLPRHLEDVVSHVDESFSEALLRHIDARGLSDPAVYKRANIDRKLFSKIRKNPWYQPSKQTALALGVALELSLDELRDLIGRAGYALTHASKADLIVEYFVSQGVYDILAINEALYAFGQPLIGR